MKRSIVALLSAGALLALLAMPAAAAHGGEPSVVVMQHICNPEIQSEEDFVAVENEGAGGEPGGEGTLPGLVATVLACPTVFLPGDTGTGGIAAEPTEFDYTVVDSGGAEYSLAADGAFMAAELCEDAIGLDVDGDGTMSPDTCLDVSMYGFEPVAEGAVTATQTAAVGDSRFGTIRFTPASTDEMTEVAAAEGVIELDTTADTQVDDPPLPLAEYNDDVVVVHVYNFQNAAAAPSATPAASMAPDTALEAPTSTGTTPLAAVVALGFIALIGGGLVLRRATRR
ncbi:MAG: hypothetical protein ACT4OQ_10750 [Chloroflexota bacterium]